MAPDVRPANAALRNETMDMRVPFQVPAKSVEDANKTRSKEFGFVVFMKHTQDNTADSREEAVQKGPVL